MPLSLRPLRLLLVGAASPDSWQPRFQALGWLSESVSFDQWLSSSSPEGPWDVGLLDASGPRPPDLWLRIHHMVPRVPYALVLSVDGPVPSSFHYPRSGGLRVALLEPEASTDVLRSTVNLARQVYRLVRPEEEGECLGSLEDERKEVLLEAFRRTERDLATLGALLDQDGTPALSPALGEREEEVLGWLMKGLSAQAVATRLGIAESTVKKHMHSIYRKKGVSGRAQLMARNG